MMLFTMHMATRTLVQKLCNSVRLQVQQARPARMPMYGLDLMACLLQQCNAMQCDAMQCNAMQCNAMASLH